MRASFQLAGVGSLIVLPVCMGDRLFAVDVPFLYLGLLLFVLFAAVTDSALWPFPFPVLGRLTRVTESDLGHCLPLYIPTLCGTQGYWEPVQVLGLGSDLQFLPRINLQTMGISDPYPDQEKAQDEICTDCEMFSKVVDWSSSLQDTFGCGSKPWGPGKLQNR